MTQTSAGPGSPDGPVGAVVPAVVLDVRDAPVGTTGAERSAPRSSVAAPTAQVRDGLGGLLRIAVRLTGLARRPLAAPLALAAAPLARVVGAGECGPAVALRQGGRDVGVDELVATATGDRLLVLVPPPGEDERVWEAGRDRTGATYAERLQALLGWTPVHVRVAAGASLTDAGLALGGLLQRLVEQWPGGVSRVVLIGSGTGGLVARGAVGVGLAGTSGPVWTGLVTELVALGTPAYAATGRAVTRSGRAADEALAGIVVADEATLALPPREDVAYLLVSDAGTSRSHPVGRLLGELLWWRHRVVGRPRRARDLFPTAERFALPTGDGPLANHPQVHDALLRWLV